MFCLVPVMGLSGVGCWFRPHELGGWDLAQQKKLLNKVGSMAAKTMDGLTAELLGILWVELSLKAEKIDEESRWKT